MINQIIQFLTSDNIQLISIVFLTIFTGVLAYFTYYLYQETKKNREYQIKLNRPELSVIFEPSEKYINWINIKIKNIGRSPLYNLELVKVENDIHCYNGKKVSELNYLKKINYFRPNQEIKQFFISFVDSKKKPEEIQFSLFFKYRDEKYKLYQKRFNFDFNQFSDMGQLGEEPLNKMAKDLEKIKENIGHFATGFSKLQVITQTKQEKRKENEEFRKQSKAKAKKLSRMVLKKSSRKKDK